MKEIKLFESEYRFAVLVWENQPVSSGELVRLAAAQLGWKKSTTYTVLKKLCDRGLMQNIDSTVTALVTRQEADRARSREAVAQCSGGSLPQFVAAFLCGGKLSAQEAAEIRRLIDARTETEGK